MGSSVLNFNITSKVNQKFLVSITNSKFLNNYNPSSSLILFINTLSENFDLIVSDNYFSGNYGNGYNINFLND